MANLSLCVFGVFSGLGSLVLVGCVSETASLPLRQPHTVGSTAGDWNDIDASVIYAATKAEMALIGTGPTHVETDESGAVRSVYLLHTITDALVYFEVRMASSEGSGPVGVSCRVERFSDAELEARLIRLFSKRLKQLEGRDVVPLN